MLYEETHYGTIAHSFNVESLDNNKVYYVRATGETVNGYLLDTGFCAFRIAYNGQLQNLEIVAKNEKREGKRTGGKEGAFQQAGQNDDCGR